MTGFELVYEGVVGKLTCFDRMIFKGHLVALYHPGGMQAYLESEREADALEAVREQDDRAAKVPRSRLGCRGGTAAVHGQQPVLDWRLHLRVHRAKLPMVVSPSKTEPVFDDLADAVASLPFRQRAVIVLRYHLGLSENEIADTLGCRSETVKSLASRPDSPREGDPTMSNPSDLDTRLTEMFDAQSQALQSPQGVGRPPRQTKARPGRPAETQVRGWCGRVRRRCRHRGRLGPPRPTNRRYHRDRGGLVPQPPLPQGAQGRDEAGVLADSLIIDVGEQTSSGAGAIEAHSDPGMVNEYTTLELTWFEHRMEMRLNIYFASDGREWWLNEIRTYDGAQQG